MSFVKYTLNGALFLAAATSVAAFGATDTTLSNETLTPGLNAYLAQRGNVCLDKTKWPIDVTAKEMSGHERNGNQMPVLEQLGLVRSSDANVTKVVEGKKVTETVRRYVLTEEGKKSYRINTPAPSSRGSHKPTPDLCAAKVSLEKIVKWSEPAPFDSKTQTVVSYTYQVDAAPWMKTDAARKTFPAIARLVDGAGKAELEEAFALTPKGWKAVDLVD